MPSLTISPQGSGIYEGKEAERLQEPDVVGDSKEAAFVFLAVAAPMQSRDSGSICRTCIDPSKKKNHSLEKRKCMQSATPSHEAVRICYLLGKRKSVLTETIAGYVNYTRVFFSLVWVLFCFFFF